MTHHYPPHQHPSPGYRAPNSGPPPAGSPYGQPYPPYSPVRRSRPPLTGSQKTAALWSGAVGFPLMTLGFAVVVSLLGWSAVVGLVSGVASQMADTDSESAQLLSDLDAMWSEYWWAFAVALVIGLVIWGIGYGASYGIAKLGVVNKVTGVTWAGLGIASAAGIILLWLGYIVYFLGVISTAVITNDASGASVVIFSIVYCILGIVIWAVVGALSWWWMAHCLRARHPDQRFSGAPYLV